MYLFTAFSNLAQFHLLFEKEGELYPPNLTVLYQEANQGSNPYWKALSNPITQASGQQASLLDEPAYQPGLEHAGKVLYRVLKDARGQITSYQIRGLNHRGQVLHIADEVMILSNS